MINGLHCVIFSRDVDADRAFFATVMGWPSVDAGNGRLFFATPPAELGLHEAEQNGRHELYLMCDDVAAEIARLDEQGIKCGPLADRGWGLMTAITLPGGGSLGLYQPRHARPYP
jgi:predicted enzyme related to lactoylglutathione lyase